MKRIVQERYEKIHPDRIVTGSNIISIIRAALAIPIIYFLKENQSGTAFIFMVICIFSDMLDGWLARISNQITSLGKMLDPLADKIVMFSVMLYLVISDTVPFFYFGVLLIRDFSISLLGVYMMNICKISPGANKLGKITIVITTATILAFIYGDQITPVNFQMPLMWVSIFFMFISAIQYFYSFIREIREKSTSRPPSKEVKTSKLDQGLSKTEYKLAARLPLIKKFFTVNKDVLEEIEETLIATDIGVDLTEELVDKLRDVKKSEAAQLKDILKEELLAILNSEEAPVINKVQSSPHIILMVGVNGTGKTTTIGKLAHRYASAGKQVMMAAADTYRAAAYQQLKIWAQRSGVEFLGNPKGKDPSGVAFDAVKSAVAKSIDVLLIDTAGRLHTKSNLMEELKKIKRVINKAYPDAPHDIWLVIEANAGQNGIVQAEQFNQAVGLSGLILTKLDGTAKGGIVLAINHKLNIPIRYLGVGEKLEDLVEFDPHDYVDVLLRKS